MNNIFGTDGIRATVGSYPLTAQALPTLGSALGRWICEQFGSHAQVLIAHDTRISSDSIIHGLREGLSSFPIVLSYAGVLTTPAVSVLLAVQPQFSCGIMISASHNPYHDNGIKVVTKQGKLTYDDELCITSYLQDGMPSARRLTPMHSFQNAQAIYMSALVNQFPTNMLTGKTIVLDCAHGATSLIAPNIFNQLGADVITLHAQPHGFNINQQCGSLHPERLQMVVKPCQADIGFAFDGDGDRLCVVTNQGVIKDGDDIVALLMGHPTYRDQQSIVGTIMSNQGLEHHVIQQQKKFIRAAVGDKQVLQALQQADALLGGEPSGHVLMRDQLCNGDSIFVALKLLETMQLTSNSSMQTYQKWPQYVLNLPITTKKDLSQEPYCSLINDYKTQLSAGRLLIRYSGTEPLLRIMVEHQDQQYACSITNDIAKKLQPLL